jgi:hypothetical protein
MRTSAEGFARCRNPPRPANLVDEAQGAFGEGDEVMIDKVKMQTLQIGDLACPVNRQYLPAAAGRFLARTQKPSTNRQQSEGRSLLLRSAGSWILFNYDGQDPIAWVSASSSAVDARSLLISVLPGSKRQTYWQKGCRITDIGPGPFQTKLWQLTF